MSNVISVTSTYLVKPFNYRTAQVYQNGKTTAGYSGWDVQLGGEQWWKPGRRSLQRPLRRPLPKVVSSWLRRLSQTPMLMRHNQPHQQLGNLLPPITTRWRFVEGIVICGKIGHRWLNISLAPRRNLTFVHMRHFLLQWIYLFVHWFHMFIKFL